MYVCKNITFLAAQLISSRMLLCRQEAVSTCHLLFPFWLIIDSLSPNQQVQLICITSPQFCHSAQYFNLTTIHYYSSFVHINAVCWHALLHTVIKLLNYCQCANVVSVLTGQLAFRKHQLIMKALWNVGITNNKLQV